MTDWQGNHDPQIEDLLRAVGVTVYANGKPEDQMEEAMR